MNLARRIYTIRYRSVGVNLSRQFKTSAAKYESTQATQPQIQEEKFDFEDLNVLERVERRQPSIPPFMKNVFVSVFNRELLAYPEILNKEESENLDSRLERLDKVFRDPHRTRDDRKMALKQSKLYAAHVSLTNGGLAMNVTESIRSLEVLSNDLELSKEVVDHWVGMQALQKGLDVNQYQQIVDDLITGDETIKLCVKEKTAERVTQADFRTTAELDSQNVWRITGEKICDNSDGYRLVLSLVEADRLKAFLVHPNAAGVTSNGKYIHFQNTPATVLGLISERDLSQTLALSRLYAAVLCRTILSKAIKTCIDYVKPKIMAGKPLSELATIRSVIAKAVLAVYASESSEYFTAGLLDGYQSPDAEVEMAMCRNYMVSYGLSNMLQLINIPSLENETECESLLNDIRHLSARGDTVESINMFISLNGIHHAGKTMSEEIKQIRNPLYYPTFFMKKMFSNRHQDNDDPKLTLYLAEHLHPSLKQPADYLEYCVLRMRYACETMLSRHGAKVTSATTELMRLAEAGTEILATAAVLARASRSYSIGLRNAELEMKFATCIAFDSKEKVQKLIKEIGDGEFMNLDHYRVKFGQRALESDTDLVEKPTARSFW